MKKQLGYLLVFLLFASCKSTKQINSATNVNEFQLDTVTILHSRDDQYQESPLKTVDMKHLQLNVSFDWEKQHMYGIANITLQAHLYPISTVELDAKNMDIKRVDLVENGFRELLYKYDSSKIYIELDRERKNDQAFTLHIEYTAKPNEKKVGGSAAIQQDRGLYFINPLGKESNKPKQIWTQGETESNSNWFPCIDKPNQKMTQEISITVENHFKTLSNGLLIRSAQNTNGTRTDTWALTQPHAPYLAMMTIGDFEMQREYWNGKELSYYVEPKFKESVTAIFGKTPAMMDFFSKKLGVTYPWPKYAQIVVRDYVSGAMENTSATLHGEFLQRNKRQLLDEDYEDIISHELFHQWFGDLVTCESWSNTALNESFATYGEYLWNEFAHGKDFADWQQQQQIHGYFHEAIERKSVDLIRFYYNDREDMFDAHSYNKGGAILHMLRKYVGDEAFFKSLELYLKTNAYKAVEIHQLRLAFEEITGKDMNRFFNQWFLNSGHPVLQIQYSSTTDSVFVKIEQNQSNDKGLTYHLPLKINVHYGGIVMTYPILLKNKKQHFAFKTFGTPDLIDIDPDRTLLCEKKENKSIAEYVYQFNHNTNYVAQHEALAALKDSVGLNETVNHLFLNALNKNFFAIRKDALSLLKTDSASKTIFLGIIEHMATEDSSNEVKKEAINYLSKFKDKKYLPMFTRILSDSSYRCVGAALNAMNGIDTTLSLSYAVQLVNEPDEGLRKSCYTILSTRYDKSLNSVFQSRLKEEGGYTKSSLFYYYANYLTHADSALVTEGINYIYSASQEDVSGKYDETAQKAIERVSDYVKKRSDAPFYESIKNLADDLIDKLKKQN